MLSTDENRAEEFRTSRGRLADAGRESTLQAVEDLARRVPTVSQQNAKVVRWRPCVRSAEPADASSQPVPEIAVLSRVFCPPGLGVHPTSEPPNLG